MSCSLEQHVYRERDIHQDKKDMGGKPKPSSTPRHRVSEKKRGGIYNTSQKKMISLK